MDTLITIALLALIWIVHFFIAIVLAGPIILKGWDRAQFRGWEALTFVVPYGIWLTAFLINHTGKSLGNFAEAFYISPVIVVAALIRVIVGHSRSAKLVPVTVFCLVCAAAFCVYWFTPGWPE